MKKIINLIISSLITVVSLIFLVDGIKIYVQLGSFVGMAYEKNYLTTKASGGILIGVASIILFIYELIYIFKKKDEMRSQRNTFAMLSILALLQAVFTYSLSTYIKYSQGKGIQYGFAIALSIAFLISSLAIMISPFDKIPLITRKILMISGTSISLISYIIYSAIILGPDPIVIITLILSFLAFIGGIILSIFEFKKEKTPQ